MTYQQDNYPPNQRSGVEWLIAGLLALLSLAAAVYLLVKGVPIRQLLLIVGVSVAVGLALALLFYGLAKIVQGVLNHNSAVLTAGVTITVLTALTGVLLYVAFVVFLLQGFNLNGLDNM